MNIRTLRDRYHLTRREFSNLLKIPYRTVEDWEAERRKPAEYLFPLIETYLQVYFSNEKEGKLAKM